MTLSLYRLFVAPALTVGIFFIAPFNAKIRSFLRVKLQRHPRPKLSASPIWIHAASGEFEYAKALIREIKSREPDTPVVVTYSSTSYIKAIENFPGVDFARPLPMDLPGPCASFLRTIRPKCLLIARTDLWPEMLHQSRRFGIPIVLFAYTQKDPHKMSALARFTRRWLLGFVDQIDCVSEDDATNLYRLGIRKGLVAGDPRYDQVSYRLQNPKQLNENLKPSLPALIAGSTWPEDENALITGLTALLKEKRLKLVITPHEPSEKHIHGLRARLNKAGLGHMLYSQNKDWSEAEVLIVDKMGILAELYQWGDMALVGGSYKGSVHSVMEPLGAGCQIFVGPYIENNREALTFAQLTIASEPAVKICPNGEALGSAVRALLPFTKERRPRILTAFQSRLGASRRLYDSLFTSVRLTGADPDLPLQN